MKWMAILLSGVIALLLAAKGIKGLQTKRVTGKWGVEYRGTTAQVLSALFLVGSVLAVLIMLGLLLGVFPV